MVDISLEILASSVPLRPSYMPRYRVKTWWAHIEVPPDVTFIKLPRLPMIQPFLLMSGKDTTVFVETWQDQRGAIIGGGGGDGGMSASKTSFLGMTTCSVDEQLKTPNLNPSVQWLDVHDPIEDTSKGKLLVKIDAKFVGPEELPNGREPHPPQNSPSRHNLHHHHNIHNHHRPGPLNDSPIKMVQSPRRSTLGANFPNYDFQSSPAVQSVTSRKSDTSVFSIHSVSSTRSQERGVQTDLSLPIIPDISKYTAGLNLRSSLGAGGGSMRSLASSGKKQNSGSDSSTFSGVTAVPVTVTSPLVDPLKYAEQILMRSVEANNNRSKMQNQSRRTSEPVPKLPTSLSSSNSSNSAFRRSCLVRQHVQQQDLNQTGNSPINNLEQRRKPKSYDLDSLGDVIDMLNHDNTNLSDLDCAFLAPDNVTVIHKPGSSKGNSASNGKPPLPSSSSSKQTQHQQERKRTEIPGITKLPSQESYNSRSSHQQRSSISSSTCSSLNQFQRQPSSSSPVSNSNNDNNVDRVRVDYMSIPSQQNATQNRFREIHFDGTQAKQTATSILMTRTTAQSTSVNPPVVTRRRIAAAIFND